MNMRSMPEIVDDVKDETTGNVKDAAYYGIATGVGQNYLGPLGLAAGGVFAGSQIGGTKGNTLSTIAMSNAIQGLLMGGASSSGGSSSRGRM